MAADSQVEQLKQLARRQQVGPPSDDGNALPVREGEPEPESDLEVESVASSAVDSDSDSDTDSDAGSDDGLNSGLYNVFYNLQFERVVGRMNFSCCPECAEEAMAEVVAARPGRLDGFAFFTAADMDHSLSTGVLAVTFGGEDYRSVGSLVCHSMWEEGLRVTWNGEDDCVEVELMQDDMALLLRLKQRDLDTANKLLARQHRLRRLFCVFRLQAFKERTARRKIAGVLLEWALRPGEPIARVARRVFGAHAPAFHTST
ncbi:hypothetical protein WJX72_000749 [[Myrmecia] bisecta]|uniref:DUF6891 domain-containing protein n=1 Tax=[Myrmecia] bisecta TaxID=41462 RepID=A0AAW1QBE7_9CHLO